MNYIIRESNRVIGMVNAETESQALNIVKTYLIDIDVENINLESIKPLEKGDMFVFANKNGYQWYKILEVQ